MKDHLVQSHILVSALPASLTGNCDSKFPKHLSTTLPHFLSNDHAEEKNYESILRILLKYYEAYFENTCKVSRIFFENTFEVSWSSSSLIQPYLPALFPTTLPHFRSTAPVLEDRNHVDEMSIFLRYLRCDQTCLPGWQHISRAHIRGFRP